MLMSTSCIPFFSFTQLRVALTGTCLYLPAWTYEPRADFRKDSTICLQQLNVMFQSLAHFMDFWMNYYVKQNLVAIISLCCWPLNCCCSVGSFNQKHSDSFFFLHFKPFYIVNMQFSNEAKQLLLKKIWSLLLGPKPFEHGFSRTQSL